MYLISLKIFEGIGEEKEIRSVFFKKGLNIIVDDSKEKEDLVSRNKSKGNNVGKTTFLRLIDICFGAKDRKYIWTDSDTNSENTKLKNYIKSNKVYAELVFNKEAKIFTLKVELFERGKKYINGEHYTEPKYWSKLNNVVFNIDSPPSFRQLIGKFIRIKQKEDANTFLKYLNSNTKNAEYRNIYNFLFQLASKDENDKTLIITQTINSLKKDKDQLIKLYSFSNINDLKERIRIISNNVNHFQEEMNKLINNNDIKQNMDNIINLKNHINDLNDKIEFLNFQQLKFESILNDEYQKNKNVNYELLQEFYHEVETSIKGIEKEFSELISFNNKVIENKINYYKERLKLVNKEIKEIIEYRNSVIDQNKNLFKVINETNFEQFEQTHVKLMEQNKQLGVLESVEKIYTSIELDLKKYEEVLNENQKKIKENDNLKDFNDYFSPLSKKVLNQNLYLSEDDNFPLKLSNVDDGFGTGYRKSITLLFDIAYVSFLNKHKLKFPRFFVHDVLETVDENNFSEIKNAVIANNSQFIFAVLNEKIKNYDFIEEEDIVLELSKDSKLFKI